MTIDGIDKSVEWYTDGWLRSRLICSLAKEDERNVVGLDRLPLDHFVILPNLVGEDAVQLDVPLAVAGRRIVQPAIKNGTKSATAGHCSHFCH